MSTLRRRWSLLWMFSPALVLAAIATSSQVSSWARASDGDLFTRIDRYIQQEMDNSHIPGIAIAILKGGDVVHRQGFGHDGHGRGITPETPFPIGSLTKSFTALATRQLAEAGRISLDDPVQQYLPWFQVADVDASSRITVRHLLNQTSGLSRASGIEPVIEESQASLQEIVRDLKNTPLNRPVGQSYEYSNLNFAVLGLLVETVSGQPWTTYIERHVFAPIGMSDSYSTFDAAREAGMTAVHQYWFGVPVRTALAYLPGLASTGYLASSADDMASYLAVYLSKGMARDTRLLSAAGIEEMLAPSTDEVTVRRLSTSFTARYGEGWLVGSFGGARDARWHLGDLPSFTAWMILLPDSDQAVVLLTNIGSPAEVGGGNSVLSRLPQGVVRLLRNEPPPSGVTVTRFYAIFDAIVVGILGTLMWLMVSLMRSRPDLTASPDGGPWFPVARTATPVVVGLGVAALLLLGAPMITLLSWNAMWRFMPDLTLVILAISALCAGCGVVRAGQLARWFTRG